MKIQVFPRLSALMFSALLVSVEPVFADNVIAKVYDINDVAAVVVSGGGHLRVVQGDTESLRVEAEPDVIERVRVDLTNHTLNLSVKNKDEQAFGFSRWLSWLHYDHHDNEQVEYLLQVKNLNYLELSGASHATLGNWVGKNMVVKASGAADVTFAKLTLDDLFVGVSGATKLRVQKLTTSKLKFELSGAANIDVYAESQSKFLKIGASGASNVHAKLLTVAQADVEASGASSVELKVTEFLKASASGASNIRYLGQPKLDGHDSGASHIKAIND